MGGGSWGRCAAFDPCMRHLYCHTTLSKWI